MYFHEFVRIRNIFSLAVLLRHSAPNFEHIDDFSKVNISVNVIKKIICNLF